MQITIYQIIKIQLKMKTSRNSIPVCSLPFLGPLTSTPLPLPPPTTPTAPPNANRRGTGRRGRGRGRGRPPKAAAPFIPPPPTSKKTPPPKTPPKPPPTPQQSPAGPKKVSPQPLPTPPPPPPPPLPAPEADEEKPERLVGRRVLDLVLESQPKQDTLLFCADGNLAAHRVLLAAASSFLKSLLADQDTGEVATLFLPDIRVGIMAKVLSLCYRGTATFLPSEEEEMYGALEALGIGPRSDLQLLRVAMKTRPAPQERNEGLPSPIHRDKGTPEQERQSSPTGKQRRKEKTPAPGSDAEPNASSASGSSSEATPRLSRKRRRDPGVPGQGVEDESLDTKRPRTPTTTTASPDPRASTQEKRGQEEQSRRGRKSVTKEPPPPPLSPSNVPWSPEVKIEGEHRGVITIKDEDGMDLDSVILVD